MENIKKTDAIKEAKEILKKYNQSTIMFSDYCERRMNKRNIEKPQVKEILLKHDDLFYIEKQSVYIRNRDLEELRYKLIFKISNRYSLIIIITEEEKILKVLNVIKTSRKIKKEWEKKILK